MSAWDGSNYRAEGEDAGRSLLDKETPRRPGIPEGDAQEIWAESEVWNDGIRPHFFDGMCQGYLLAKKSLSADLLDFIKWYNKLPTREIFNKQFKEIIELYLIHTAKANS